MKPRDFHLKFPQWNGYQGDRIIGLGSYLFKNTNIVHVYCDYRTKNGTKLWDNYLVCTHDFAKKYPLLPLINNKQVKLYRIPLQELLTFQRSNESTPPVERKKVEHKENKRLAKGREEQYIVHMNLQKHKWNAFEFARSFANQPNAPIYILEGKDRYECAGSIIEPYDNGKPSTRSS